MLQVNENLDKKIQELETRLTNTNDDLKKTKEDLGKTQNIIKQYKEENIHLEDKLFKYKKDVIQADTMSSRQKDVMTIFQYCLLLFRLHMIIICVFIYYVCFID